MVILTGEAALRRYSPDLAAIAATGHKALLVTAAADPGSGADYVLRVFGPNVGIDEDPATGSAQCVGGPLLVRRPRATRHGGAPALTPRGGAPRASGRQPGAHRGERRHGVHGPPVLSLRDMATPSVQVRALVAEHRPTSPREADAKARFLAELDRLADPYNEHADPTHVTASAIVVGTRGTVLHLHKRLARWMQPGGHIDPGEEPPDAALREAVEELGLEVAHPRGGPRLIHVDVHEAALGHTHLDLRYLLFAAADDPHPPPGESPEARWFGWEEAEAIADDALAPALTIARAQWDAADE